MAENIALSIPAQFTGENSSEFEKLCLVQKEFPGVTNASWNSDLSSRISLKQSSDQAGSRDRLANSEQKQWG